MPDYQFTRFPIPGKQVDFEAMQNEITTLQERASELQRQLDALTASEVPYDNTASELTATNVQDAIDEIDEVVDDAVPKTREINGYDLSADRTLFVQDFGSKNLLDSIKAGFIPRDNYGVSRTLASDGTGIVLSGTAIGAALWANSSDVGTLVLPAGDYIASFEYSGTGTVNSVGYLLSTGSTVSGEFTIPSGGATIKNFCIFVPDGGALNGTLYPMIRPAGTDDTYVPYAKTNVELSKMTIYNIDSFVQGGTARITVDANSTFCFRIGSVVYINLQFTANVSLSGNTITQSLPKPVHQTVLLCKSTSRVGTNAEIRTTADGVVVAGVQPGDFVSITGTYIAVA